MLTKELSRIKRHRSIRKKVTGTAERPRLAVHRSARNLFLQVVDDMKSITLCSFSTLDKDFIKTGQGKATKVQSAQRLGELFVKILKEKGIERIAFDRGGYPYHGRIKAIAEALRQGGIHF